MKRLRIILLCSLLFVCFYTIFITKNRIYKTKYKDGQINLTGYIIDIHQDLDKITVILKAKEKIKVSYYTKEDLHLKLGDYIQVSGELTKPKDNTVFHLYNYRLYLMSQKIYHVLRADSIIKMKDNSNIFYKIKNSLYERMNVLKSNTYLKTFILGDRSSLDKEIKTIYQENGISHLLAISGMHISLLSSSLLFLFKRKKYSHGCISLFLIFYAFLVGFTPSVIRAVVFLIFYKIDKKYLLLLLTCILLVYNPYYIYNVGFLFSFIISFYLILFHNKINQVKNYFVQILLISTISFLASLPILINNFYMINIISPFINILFVPFISCLIFPLCLITLCFPFLDIILFFFLMILESISLFLNHFNIELVMCSIPIYLCLLYYLLITFVIIKPKYSYLLIIVLLFHHNVRYFNQNSYLTMIDVGQGDSTLIEHKNVAILVDTGGVVNSNYSIALNTTIPYLKSLGIQKLNFLILTHNDYDHMGEAFDLLNNFRVDNVIMNSGKINEMENKLIPLLKSKKVNYDFISEKTINFKNFYFNFINDKEEDNENEDSLILFTKIENRNILLMGDAGKVSENYIMDAYNLPIMDILKVGHHGSKTSSGKEFIDAIQPKIALISAGKNNRYQHPNSEVIDILNNNYANTYVTSIDGSIRINLKNLKIYTCSNVYANGC